MAKKPSKKTDYLLFCTNCGIPQIVTKYNIAKYFKPNITGIYCKNATCNEKIIIPDHLKKISREL